MIPYKWPLATAVPDNFQVRLEIAKAMQTLAQERDELLKQRQAEIASIRNELQAMAQDIAKLCDWTPSSISPELRRYGYNPDEPRIPKRHAGGGEWTRENGSDEYASAIGIFSPRAVTNNPAIDNASRKFLALLTEVVDRVGPRDSLLPTQYGTKIHTEFAAVVKAAALSNVQVEQTFGPNVTYGSEDSVRTDVLLRDDSGNILAIWDVKTGNARLEPWRVRELRAKTGTTSETYMFELSVGRGLSVKYRHHDLNWQRRQFLTFSRRV